METRIEYSDKRGGFYFVTKEYGDCLYSPTLDLAIQEARGSWGQDADIVLMPSAIRADFRQLRKEIAKLSSDAQVAA